MKDSLLFTGLVMLCYFAVSNQQLAFGDTTPSSKIGRAINTSGKNRILVGDDESDNDDSGFDGLPEGDEIKFPSDISPTLAPVTRANARYNESLWKKIPLKTLVQLGNETNISSFFSKYLQNVKVKKDPTTNEEYLIDNTNGIPIYNSKNQKVIITPGRQGAFETPSTSHVAGGSTRSGSLPVVSPRLRTTISVNDIAGMKTNQEENFNICTPEMTTIPIPITTEPHILIIPRCLRVERCGGCCLSDLLGCEPEKIEKAEFRIKKLAFTGDSDRPAFVYVDDQIVHADRHLSCKCQCRTKKEDCNKVLHDYVENECSCRCKNRNEYEHCLTDSNKIWDESNCMCLCRETRPCNSGQYYNLNDCECQDEEKRIKKKKRGVPSTIHEN